MNILWISFYGSWTLPLLNEIANVNTGKVGMIIPVIGGKTEKCEMIGRIQYITIPFTKHELFQNMTSSTFLKFNKYIELFNPDVIHVHGTEKNLGQIQNYIKSLPIVISIQGILQAYRPYYLNYIEKSSLYKFKTLKNCLRRGGVDRMKRIFEKGRCYETDIIRNGKFFFARTNWDKSHLLFENQQAIIFHGEELLRDEFYENCGSWNVEGCDKYTVFMPCGMDPIKGLHQSIATIYLLKRIYSSVKLIVPGMNGRVMNRSGLSDFLFGEEYIRYVKSLITKYDLSENVVFLDRLDAKGMAEQMKRANAFLSPSSIDNSPNAVGEATMIGMPIVATSVGGIPSFLRDEEECLFAPAGDPYMMAFQLDRIFKDSELASKLGHNAFSVALKRHNKAIAVQQYLNAYQSMIGYVS